MLPLMVSLTLVRMALSGMLLAVLKVLLKPKKGRFVPPLVMLPGLDTKGVVIVTAWAPGAPTPMAKRKGKAAFLRRVMANAV